jgi:hypothetical protein
LAEGHFVRKPAFLLITEIALSVLEINFMNFDPTGANLIFLISQPRVGSTMLQRILGSHPDIHTLSEPWLMLHPLYALRSEGYQAEYNEQSARSALRSFLQVLPAGEDDYLEGVRRMAVYLYGRGLANSGKRHFLDKTPRYYLVIPELYRTFPKARYIILWRNPLAVLCSILKTWIKQNWFLLDRYEHDLVRAPYLLLEGVELLGSQCVSVRYERLVSDPENETRRICNSLGVTFVPEMIEYGRHDIPPDWAFGDPTGVHQHVRPNADTAEKWLQALGDPQIWRLNYDYLRLLGRETVEQMGYSYEELSDILRKHRPARVRGWFTFSLAWLLSKPLENRRWWIRDTMRLVRSFQCRGVSGTVAAVVRKVAHALSNPK